MSPSAIQSFAQPLLDTFLELPVYARVLSIIIGFPTIAIALNVLSQVVRFSGYILRSELIPRLYQGTLLYPLWYSITSLGSEVQHTTVRTHTSFSLNAETRYVGQAVRLSMSRPSPFDKRMDADNQYGDLFSFKMMGRTMTVALGPKGNNLSLGGKVSQVSAEDAYTVSLMGFHE